MVKRIVTKGKDKIVANCPCFLVSVLVLGFLVMPVVCHCLIRSEQELPLG